MRPLKTKPGATALFALFCAFVFNTTLFAEALGPSTHRTGLTFSEIMYHPADRPDGKHLEFIEIYNSEAMPRNLSGFRLSGDVDYLFPTNTVLAGSSFLVVAANPTDLQSVYGIPGVFGPIGNG